MQRALIRVGAMRRKVRKDFDITVGGPVGQKNVIASFKKGDIVEVKRIGKKRDYPMMYRIIGIFDGRIFSSAVLTQFLHGFEPRKRTKPGSS